MFINVTQQKLRTSHEIRTQIKRKLQLFENVLTTVGEIPQKYRLDGLHHCQQMSTSLQEIPRTLFLSNPRGTFPEVAITITAIK